MEGHQGHSSVAFSINNKFNTYRSEVSAGRFPFVSHSTTTCNSPFSASKGVRDGGANVFPQVHRPPTVQVFLNGRGFAQSSTKNRKKEKQLRKVSGTNQNMCFVKFTFTDCLVEFSLCKTQL